MKSYPDIFTYPDSDHNMWGNADDVTYHALHDGQRFFRQGTYSYKDCKQRHQFNHRQWFSIRPMDGTFLDQINQKLAPKQDKCIKCNVGVVDWEKFAFQTDKKTWILRFYGVGVSDESQGEDYHNLPPTIPIKEELGNEHVFKLQSGY